MSLYSKIFITLLYLSSCFFSDILFSSTSSSSAEGSADVVSSNDLVAQIEVCLAPQVLRGFTCGKGFF